MNIKIIGYLISVIVIHLMFGNKATYWFVLLVLFGVLVANIDKISNVLNNPEQLKNSITGGK